MGFAAHFTSIECICFELLWVAQMWQRNKWSLEIWFWRKWENYIWQKGNYFLSHWLWRGLFLFPVWLTRIAPCAVRSRPQATVPPSSRACRFCGLRANYLTSCWPSMRSASRSIKQCWPPVVIISGQSGAWELMLICILNRKHLAEKNR